MHCRHTWLRPYGLSKEVDPSGTQEAGRPVWRGRRGMSSDWSLLVPSNLVSEETAASRGAYDRWGERERASARTRLGEPPTATRN